MPSRRPWRAKTRGPRKSPQNLEDSQKHIPNRLIFSQPLLSQDAVRLWTCVCGIFQCTSSSGDAAQAAFHRTTSHCRREVPDLRAQGNVYRPLVCTADGRPHPAVTRTLHDVADIASCRIAQQMSATALPHRWKHEIQIALLWRRAAMTRAVLPNMSAGQQWLLAAVMDRAASHWVRAPPLVGGDEEDADTGTDTTAPDDDNDDIASFTSQQTAAIQTSNL